MTGARIEGLRWEDILVGHVLPELPLKITYLRAASHPAGTRDYFPGHHDPEYARGQGQPDLYVNTMFLHGVLDRLVLGWTGPAWFLSRRKMAMHSSIYVHETLIVSGKVTAKDVNDAGDHLVTVAIQVNVEGHLRVSGDADVIAPDR